MDTIGTLHETSWFLKESLAKARTLEKKKILKYVGAVDLSAHAPYKWKALRCSQGVSMKISHT